MVFTAGIGFIIKNYKNNKSLYQYLMSFINSKEKEQKTRQDKITKDGYMKYYADKIKEWFNNFFNNI